MSYCSLEEAFPQLTKDSSVTRDASCWSQNTCEIFSAAEKQQPKVMGAQVSAVIQKQAEQQQQQHQPQPQNVYVVPSFQCQPPPHLVQENNRCFLHLQHCLRCPMCYQMLQVLLQQPKGAQVTVAEKPQRKIRSILSEPIFEGSPVTWGTILTLIAGGTLVLLVLEIGKRIKQ